MSTLIINDRRVYYTRPQKLPGAPQLLLVHGAGGSHLDWPREIQRLPGTDVFNLDLPGHGRSEGEGYNDIASYARDVEGFVEATGLNRLSIAGHSMGGAISLLLALSKPSWLQSIVLIGSGAHLPVSPQIHAGLKSELQSTIQLIMRAAWSSQAAPSLVDLAAQSMAASGSEVLQRNFVACDTFDVRERLTEVEVPVLIICGEEDRMTPAGLSIALAEGIPDSHLAIVAGAGHYVTLEQPQAVADAMARFIRESSSPGKQVH